MDCISKYRIAFHMLWRLKRVEWTLAITWKQHTMFNHSHRRFVAPRLRAVFHRCYLNRAMMMHVVNNLCAFLMFEVLETAWADLQSTIREAQCLDDVITAHDAYLNEVLDKALLAPHHEGLNLQVQQLLHTVLRFCNMEETLIAGKLVHAETVSVSCCMLCLLAIVLV
jgi:gamma-tubulin complex component 3